MGGGRLWEVPVYGFDRKYFWCFAKVVSYGRWSPTGGGRTWRFDCTYVHPLMLVNVTYLLRLFTIYMGKLVGPWFGQLVPKIQDWYISSRICIYYLYKSGILHNLCTPQTSTVRHYWPICWSTLDRHISWLSVDMLLDTRSICWPVHWPTYQLTCQLTLDRVSAWSTVM